MSSQLTPQLSSDSSPGQAAAAALGLRPNHDMLTSPPPGAAAKGLEDNRDGWVVLCFAPPSSLWFHRSFSFPGFPLF